MLSNALLITLYLKYIHYLITNYLFKIKIKIIVLITIA
ncbi:hypothetical protein A1OE_1297 [Candidatus Endolissoclinum faulkneri L2]|uniref:Uncharacterized protein n=1 Tax=Candidatus Endolissoclinum faulkneri L2 TaxID=1193729 RepID=K7YIP7_9PROT|nr:hypothetical protein A1OE_1297 [Candidatus Endolissoclinum faulkneri L2]